MCPRVAQPEERGPGQRLARNGVVHEHLGTQRPASRPLSLLANAGVALDFEVEQTRDLSLQKLSGILNGVADSLYCRCKAN